MDNFTPENIIVILLVLISYTLLQRFVEYWEAKRKPATNEYTLIDMLSRNAVRYVEAEFAGEKGSAKLDAALEFVESELAKRSISIDRDFVVRTIEAHVFGMRNK